MNENETNRALSSIYSEISQNEHTETRDDRLVLHENYDGYSALATIERLVAKVLVTPDVAFDVGIDERGGFILYRRPLAKMYEQLGSMLAAFSPTHIYSPKVEVFFDSCRQVMLLTNQRHIGNPLEVDAVTNWRFCDLFNELIELIRVNSHKARFRKRLSRHERNVRRRTARGLFWEQELFAWRSRHLILLLSLGYRVEHRQAITPEIVQEHLKRLLSNRRAYGLLQGIDGYVWKIEEGDKTGLHVHMLIAYTTERKAGITVNQEIGEYWRDVVTEGQGTYWNSNREKFRHKGPEHVSATGQINHDDEQARAELRKVITYLAKSDQYLRRKGSLKFRTFGMSQMLEKKRPGRPRKLCHPLFIRAVDDPVSEVIGDKESFALLSNELTFA